VNVLLDAGVKAIYGPGSATTQIINDIQKLMAEN